MELRPPTAPPTSPAHWRRVAELFDRAVALPPGGQAALLDGEADAGVRAEVERLLALDAEPGPLLATLLLGVGGGVGTQVGPYRVVGVLGEGGMGTVLRASRADGAFERDVALKVLHAVGDGRRFRAERQILARLDHPHIARLYGGGVTADGRPWLAMELVDGEPLTGHCDRLRLDVPARLALFRQVCAAVHYAHGRLVVHRDLKPSNVLVTAAGEVKLLDFGIAKLLDGGVDLTLPGAAPRTPAYAAPEQIEGGEVTTATDVYALGVLLYELLAGVRPHPARGRAAVERAIVATEPTAPSAAAGPSAADARATDPARLRRRLQGDLDHIALKALQKAPADRYASAAALGTDVGRHAAGLPVEARSASRWVRARLFARRHRAGVAGAVAVVAALGVGLGLAVWQGRVSATERDRAERAAAFMVEVLGEFDPNQAGAGRLDAADALDRAVRRVETGLRGQPSVQARLYDHVGQIYQTYTRYDDAERLLGRALAVRRGLYGDEHPEVAESLNHLGWLAFARGAYAEADSLYAAALAAAEGRRTPTAAAAIEGRGLLRRAAGDPEGGLPFVREALAIREATLGPDHTETYRSVSALATMLHTAGRPAEAAPLFRRAIAGHRRTLGAHVHTAQSLSDYGAVLTDLGDVEGATAAHREALGIRRELLGGSHPHVAQSLSHLGWALQRQGRYAEAEPLYREALAIRLSHLGADHASVGNSQLVLGEVRLLQGDAAGLDTVAEGARTLARALGPDHPTTASAELRWATHLEAIGRGGEARALAARALPVLEEAFGADHAKTRACRALLARGAEE